MELDFISANGQRIDIDRGEAMFILGMCQDQLLATSITSISGPQDSDGGYKVFNVKLDIESFVGIINAVRRTMSPLLNTFTVEQIQRAMVKASGRKRGIVLRISSDESDQFERRLRSVTEILSPMRTGPGDFNFSFLADDRKASRFPRVWELFGYLLPAETRSRVYYPAYQDLLANYLTTRAEQFQTPCAQRWLTFCFTARTVGLVVQSFQAMAAQASVRWLLAFVPDGMLDWLRTFRRPPE